MTKLLIVSTFAVFFTGHVLAQTAITLQKSNTPLLAGTVHYKDVPVAGFKLPNMGAANVWDYSSLVPDTSVSQNFILNTNTGFTASKTALADTGKYEFLTSDNSFHLDNIYDEDANGLYLQGCYVKAQKFSLVKYFNDTADKITVPQQDLYFRINQVSFPTTAGSAHNMIVKKKLNFILTVDTMHYKKDSSAKVTTYLLADTVAGWGTLRIPSPTGPSRPYAALLVRRATVSIDSYYVQRQVPKAIYLKALGITQAQKNIDYKETFYRTGSSNPLLVIDFGTDGTFKNPVAIRYSTDSIKEQSGVDMPAAMPCKMMIYPNPAADMLHISFQKPTSETWILGLTRMSGQQVCRKTITGSGEINMPLDISYLSPGIYLIKITGPGGQTIASGQVVRSR